MTSLSMAEQQQQEEKPDDMEFFFGQIEDIKNDIKMIEERTNSIHELNIEANLATTTSQEEECSKRLRPLVDASNMSAKLVKKRLEMMTQETKRLNDIGELKPSDIRIRENLCRTLTMKFIDVMKAYQSAQQKYRSDMKEKVKRQILIVKPDATDEEVDEVMKSEGGREALMKEQILAGGINDSIKTTYEHVKGKYEDVKQIEESIKELHQMFMDFALLTQQQGELLDQIEFNVKDTIDYVEDGNVELVEAVEIQKEIRKKQLITMVIVVVALLILLKF